MVELAPPPGARIRQQGPPGEAPVEQQPGEIAPPPGARIRAPGEARAAPTGAPAQIQQFGRSAVGEAAEFGTMMAGAAAGGAIGATAAAPLTPFFPPAPVVGAAIGFVGGGMLASPAAHRLRDFLSEAKLPISDAPLAARRGEAAPELRGAEFAGEIFGGSFMFGGGALGAARMAPKALSGTWLGGVTRFAQEAPGRFAVTELASASSAAAAGGVVLQETDDPLMAGGAAAAAGVLSPMPLSAMIWSRGGDILRRFTMRFSQSARETQAGKLLTQIVEAHGEDPQVVMRLLAEADPDGLYTTAAQKTGSIALASLEGKLAARSDAFRGERQRIATEAFDTLEGLLRSTGDPQALHAAALVRQARYEQAIAGRMKVAEADVADAARRLRGDTAETRSELARVARKALEDALEDVRGVEREMWANIPESARAARTEASNLFSRYDDVRGGMTREARLPGTGEATVARMRAEMREAEPVLPSVQELMALRTELLQDARAASLAGKHLDARRLGQLAQGVMKDLDVLPVAPEFREAYEMARQFSRELNDTFTRSFAGRVRAEGRFGEAMPPEILLHNATATGPELKALRLAELEEATRFLPDRGIGTDEHWRTMMDAQERYVRLAITSSLDSQGNLNVAQLRQFRAENKEILDRFPDSFRADIDQAISSTEALQRWEGAIGRATPIVKAKTAFARLAEVDNPVTAIRGALSSSQPDTRLTAMARLAAKSGPEASEGMFAASVEAALRASRQGDAPVNANMLERALFLPTQRGNRSVMDILQSEGVITAEQADNARHVVERMSEIQTAVRTGAGVEGLIQDPSALFDLILRVSGARAGAATARGAGAGFTLIAAQRGSTFVRELFQRVPEQQVEGLLRRAALDPPFAALLMEKYAQKTPDEMLRHFSRLHAYMIQTGILTLGDDDVSALDLIPPLGDRPSEQSEARRRRATIEGIRGTAAEVMDEGTDR